MPHSGCRRVGQPGAAQATVTPTPAPPHSAQAHAQSAAAHALSQPMAGSSVRALPQRTTGAQAAHTACTKLAVAAAAGDAGAASL